MGFQRDCLAFSRGLLICIDFSSDFRSIFHHFLIPRNLNFSVFAKARIKKSIFSAFPVNINFLSILGANMTLKILQKSRISGPSWPKLGNVGDMLLHLGAMLGHLGAIFNHFGAMLDHLATIVEKC